MPLDTPGYDDLPMPEKVPLLDKLSTDIDVLGRDFDPGENKNDEPTSFRTCYNRSCEDYRVERDARIPCECQRLKTPVKGAEGGRSMW